MYEKLLTTMKERQVSRNRLAIKSGISPSDLYSALAGNKPLYPGWRKKIAAALEAPEEELFEDEKGVNQNAKNDYVERSGE